MATCTSPGMHVARNAWQLPAPAGSLYATSSGRASTVQKRWLESSNGSACLARSPQLLTSEVCRLEVACLMLATAAMCSCTCSCTHSVAAAGLMSVVSKQVGGEAARQRVMQQACESPAARHQGCPGAYQQAGCSPPSLGTSGHAKQNRSRNTGLASALRGLTPTVLDSMSAEPQSAGRCRSRERLGMGAVQ